MEFSWPGRSQNTVPPSTLPLSVGRHHYNYSNVWFTNYKTEKNVWALGNDNMGPKKAQKTALSCSTVCIVQVSSSESGDRWNIQWNMTPILMLNGLLTTPLSMRCCTAQDYPHSGSSLKYRRNLFPQYLCDSLILLSSSRCSEADGEVVTNALCSPISTL